MLLKEEEMRAVVRRVGGGEGELARAQALLSLLNTQVSRVVSRVVRRVGGGEGELARAQALLSLLNTQVSDIRANICTYVVAGPFSSDPSKKFNVKGTLLPPSTNISSVFHHICSLLTVFFAFL